MKIIGVTGKSGSGKTTFAEILNTNLPNSEIIHIDDICLLLKKKFFPFFFKNTPINSSSHNSSQCIGVQKNPTQILVPKKHILKLFFLFPFLNKIQLKFIKLLGKSILEEKISKAEKNSRDFVIIEGIILHELFDKFDVTYRIKRPHSLRYNNLISRDGKKFFREFNKRDALYNSTEKRKDEQIIINNTENFEDFQAQIQPLAENLQQTRTTTFAEKYRIMPPQGLTKSCKKPFSSHSPSNIEPHK